MNTAAATAPAATVCASCGTEIGARLLSCPSCRRLVHADELGRLAAQAERAAEKQEIEAALAASRSMLELLPEGSSQHREMALRADALSREIESRSRSGDASDGGQGREAAADRRARLGRVGAGFAGAGLLLWKLKFVIGFLLTKGKLLVLGLTKASTLFSMLLSFGVYWTAWGWRFALGLVLSIYIHEMGHVAQLRRFGIRASAPMFLPGLGAMVRLKQLPDTPRQEARVGLAGPVWGLVGAVATYGLHLVTGWASLAAIAQVAAWINLFNLMPVWQLDGNRAFNALTRGQRLIVVVTIAVMWFVTREGLLVLIFAVSALRVLSSRAPEHPDRMVLVQMIALVVALSMMVLVPVPVASLLP
jgi:Zn-dependent protease